MKKQVEIKKASVYAVAINSVQIALVLGIAVYLFLSCEQIHQAAIRLVVLGAAVLVSWGAVVDIREALGTSRILDRFSSIEESFSDLTELNNTLRAQRHDFLNHLQVVYSLMEMEEYKEAQDYIEKVYGDIRAVSRVMRTANPAVNALLMVKLDACEKHGVHAELHIASAWKDLSIPDWEMCRVLGNIIDNALDAMKETIKPVLTIDLSEDLKTFRFAVANNGPDIPPEDQERIFLSGVTTKAEGHGMGLFIVRDTLREAGGDISLSSGDGQTVFSGWVPKGSGAPEAAGSVSS
jgi:sensor histidine kinase regulating citrate/malate metabolism